MKIKVSCKNSPERKYVLDLLLGEFLGLDLEYVFFETNKIVLTLPGGKILSFADIFLTQFDQKGLDIDLLPVLPLKYLDLEGSPFLKSGYFTKAPLLFGDGFFQEHQETLEIDFDLFGSSFFMLSRFEEYVVNKRDEHDRFPATSSFAHKAEILERPLVNEYLEILKSLLHYFEPNIVFKKRNFRTLVSCDVDIPYDPARHYLPQFIRRLAANALKQRSPRKFWQTLKFFFGPQGSKLQGDPQYTFDFIMQACEEVQQKCSFYFITENTDKKKDSFYTMFEPIIQNLLKEIYSRGHEVGLHTSYQTYLNTNQTQKEFKTLKEACQKAGVKQEFFGGRQHFLRFKMPQTIQNWQKAGLNYDSSLGFADHAGFRAGICYEYPLYDLQNRQKLDLKERPLVLMEESVMAKRYMNKGYTEESLAYMKKLKDICRAFEGDFTLLWHNSHFHSVQDKTFYKELLKA